MTERKIVAEYTAKIDGYLTGLAKMKTATGDFGKDLTTSAAKSKADWDKIGGAALVTGAAIGAAVVGAVKVFADFDAAMSGVVAALDDGTKSAATLTREKKLLGEAAIQAGQDTVFSATEAARAEAELSRAGVQTADILGGALKGSLDLAAAGQVDLAKAAEVSAQAMNVFGLEGAQVGHIADVLTAGANKSAAGVEDLGMALQQSALVAKQTGLSLEDTVGTLAAFADNALKGSDAGTSLKTMLQRLTPQSTEQARAMETLGLKFYDAQGAFIGIDKVAGQLQNTFGNMSAEQRNAAMQTIFGSDAVRAATILMEQGEAGIRRYIAGVNDLGAAQRMAQRQTDNLKGDIEQLKGTLESAFIRGGSGANDGLRSVVQNITEIVDRFNGLPPSVQSGVVQVAALTAGLLLASGAAIKATTSVLAMKASLDAAGIAGARLSMTLKGIGAAVAIAGVAAIANALVQMQAAAAIADVSVDDLADSLEQLSKSGELSGGIADLFRNEGGLLVAREEFVSTAEAIERFASTAQDALGDDLYHRFVRMQDMGEGAAKLDKYISSLDEGLAQMVRNGNADQAKASLDRLLSGIKDQAVVDEVRGRFEQYQAALDEAAISAENATGGVDKLGGALDESAKAAQDAAKAYQEAQNAIEMMGGGVRAEQAALRSYRGALDDAQKAMKDGNATMDERRAALDKVAEASLAVVTKQMDMGRGADEIAASMQQQREAFIEVATAMTGSADMAAQLADAMGLIPDEVRPVVEAVGAVKSTAQVLDLGTSIFNLEGKTVTVAEAGADESNRRVLTLDGSIFGLDGKTVQVQEIGATASGERVVTLDGQIYKLQGKTVTITANTSQAMNAIAGVDGYLKLLDGRVARAYVNVASTYSGPQRPGGLATGGSAGLVVGPGTSTSDSVGPVMLSNREYVIKAAAVERYGVRLFDDLNAMRLASGGRPDFSRMRPAPATAYATRASVTTTASAAPLDPATIRAALDGATLRLGPVDSITREVTAQLVTAYSRSV